MELRQLKYFLAVADSGSLSRAALEVFIAQSALSKQIAELEEALGVQLLYRSRTGVTVTEAGKTFYSYAQAILKQLGDVNTAVRASPQSIVGSVVLGLPQSVSARAGAAPDPRRARTAAGHVAAPERGTDRQPARPPEAGPRRPGHLHADCGAARSGVPAFRRGRVLPAARRRCGRRTGAGRRRGPGPRGLLAVCHSRHIPLTHAKQAVRELVFAVAGELCGQGQWTGATYVGP